MSCSAYSPASALIDTFCSNQTSTRPSLQFLPLLGRQDTFDTPYASDFRSTFPTSTTELDSEYSEEFSPESLTKAVSSSRPSRSSSIDGYLERSDACIPVDTLHHSWLQLWAESEGWTPVVEDDASIWIQLGTRRPALGSGWDYDSLAPVKPRMEAPDISGEVQWEMLWDKRESALRRLQGLYKHISYDSPLESNVMQ